MQSWRTRYLGVESIPAWLSDVEIDQFFTLSPGDIALIRTRRGKELQLGLALHIGFIRMSGRLLNGTDVLPYRLLEYLGQQLGFRVPRVASLRALYPRKQTLHEHQHLAAAHLDFRQMNERIRRQLVAHLKRTRGSATTPESLLLGARQWAYAQRVLMPTARELLDAARQVLADEETLLAQQMAKRISPARRKRWSEALAAPHVRLTGITHLEWLKRSPRSRRGHGLLDAFDRYAFLIELGINDLELPSMPVDLVKAYAMRVARLKLTRFNRLQPATREIGLACFLKLSLWRTCDEAVDAWLMRVSELRRQAIARARPRDAADWEQRYRDLVSQLLRNSEDASAVPLTDIVAEATGFLHRTRADRMRQALLDMHSSIRNLLRLVLRLPLQWRQPRAPLVRAVEIVQLAYQKHAYRLSPTACLTTFLSLWQRVLVDADDERRFHVLEVATLLALHRALRCGDLYIGSSLSYREKDALLMPAALWQSHRPTYMNQLGGPFRHADALRAVVPYVKASLRTLAQAVKRDEVLIGDDGIRLIESTPSVDEVSQRARAAFAAHVGTVELPQLMMEVDSQTRFSTTLLKHTPRHASQLMAIYGALLAHGMGLDRIQVQRMMPGLSDAVLQQCMALLEEEGRLVEANHAVIQYMRRHPVTLYWGEEGLASSDMMTIEASRRLWNARIDPRTGNYAIGTYTHVLDQWGIAYDQPIVLNRRQAGAALEGVLMQRLLPIDRLAVDTHGYTDVAMGLARLLGFELCPRLAMLRERKLYVPKDLYVPKPLRAVAVPLPLNDLKTQWDALLRLAVSIREGWCSATQVLGRWGSDARSDPLHRAATTFGRLIRTQYLCRYYTDAEFRLSIRRVLNHGESVHQLQRAIHPYAIGPKRGRCRDEQRAISGSLALLSNLVMAWNTAKLQSLLDQAGSLDRTTQSELLAAGPVATSQINFRGVLSFPVETLGEPILREPRRWRA